MKVTQPPAQQPTPAVPEWAAHHLAHQAAWEQDAVARYITVAGATVDITYTSHSGLLLATCTGCHHVDRTDTGAMAYDPPEKEQARIERHMPTSRKQAQAHASVCRALPRLAVTGASEPRTQGLDDGTPINDPAAALHWAAESYNLAARREAQGKFLNADEQANYHRFQNAARSHGYTEHDVRIHAATLSTAVTA